MPQPARYETSEPAKLGDEIRFLRLDAETGATVLDRGTVISIDNDTVTVTGAAFPRFRVWAGYGRLISRRVS